MTAFFMFYLISDKKIQDILMETSTDWIYVEYTKSQKEMLQAYLSAIIEANKTMNLTTIKTVESGWLLHIEDSLIGLPEFQSAPTGRYADLGTGGGFPGVPLSIMTGKSVMLVDSVKKKMTIVRDIIARIGLDSQIRTYDKRIEELAQEQPRSFEVLTARALAPLPSLIELAAPLLTNGGRLISYKAMHLDQEIRTADMLEGKIGMKRIGMRTCLLSDGVTPRSIVVFEKIHEPEVELPRRIGVAQKRPYKA